MSTDQLPHHPIEHHHSTASAALSADAHQPHPHHGGQHSLLHDSEHKLEHILKHDPHHHHMGEVYKELDHLRTGDEKHFHHNLDEVNKKLHHDGYLPGLTIVSDHYTGADKKDHVGYSIISNNKHNPGHRMGSEVSTSHPQVQDTPTSRNIYHSMHHGHRQGFAHDSADGGHASNGGWDAHLRGQEIPKGERKELIDKALEKAGVSVNAQTEAAMNRIITRESGWDTNAVNTWDRNARNGDPSKGLMQVIHSTFEAHRDKSLPDSQTDPMANMVAALRYMGSRYGHGNNEAGLMRAASRSGGY